MKFFSLTPAPTFSAFLHLNRSSFKMLAGTCAVGLLTSPVVVASAAAVTDLGGQLQICAAIKEGTERLACFDKIAGTVTGSASRAPISAAGGAIPVASSPPASTASPASGLATAEKAPPCHDAEGGCTADEVDEDEAGSRYLRRDSIKELKENPRVFVFTLTEAKRNARGRWLFYFDNGQIWKQIDSRGAHIPDTPVEAQIKVGSFGSHKLSIGERVRGIKIKRLK